MTLFRPCIDLHNGRVKQIVGGSLTDDGQGLRTNFETDRPAREFAEMYQRDGLKGGHVIQLGPGNRDAAIGALEAFPGGLQLGGGITPENADEYLAHGASHVIVTSYLFPGAQFSQENLDKMVDAVGKERLVIDLSCRRHGDSWVVAMNRWQTPTDMAISHTVLERLSAYCDEFLVHAADVEGRCRGIDEDLVAHLGAWGKIPVTYAGGATSLDDLRLVDKISGGKVDLTIGSALDIFGGRTARYVECAAFNDQPRR
ncbi:MAG: phosphoribosylformimino-5-aminoimidazole carboxamide ribotide isomerase [Candidatus Pacebacteria bacterium]|nr:phosphoribosylformimino-5-aminoimidazole carboxamide ribotide isomerase [Candidatus Paceibacterota bacterium]